MNNTITLYKSEFTPSSPRQPYFKSVTGRNSYLESLESIELNLNNPNIVIASNLNINIVAPIDITLIEDYTLAKIVYNEKEYFIYAIDFSMVSVGFTRIYGHRSVAFECINYFSKFGNFDISKITVSYDDIYFGENSIYETPSLKISQREKSLVDVSILKNDNIPFNVIRNGKVYTRKGIGEILCVVVSVSQSVSNLNTPDNKNDYKYLPTSIDGVISGFSTLVIPIYDLYRDVNDYYLVCKEADETKFARSSPSYEVNKFVRAISPFVYNVSILRLPAYRFTFINEPDAYMLPYNMGYEVYNNETTIEAYKTIEFASLNSRIKDEYDYELSYDFTGDEIYGKYTIQLYGEHEINLDLRRIISTYSENDSVNTLRKLLFNIKYIFNSDGVYLHIERIPQYKESVIDYPIDNYIEVYNYKLNSGITFFVSAEEDFLAQNKYYDSITENEVTHVKIKGGINASSSIATGLVQTYIGGVEMGVSGGKAGYGGLSQGSSNIIRGIYQAMETMEDVSYLESSRFYMAQNEKNKPDTEKDNSENGYSLVTLSVPIFRVLYSVPFGIDFSNYKERILAYGTTCSIYFSTFVEFNSFLNKHIDDNDEFSISMNMIQTNDNHYSNQQNNEIKTLTKGGLLYKLYE